MAKLVIPTDEAWSVINMALPKGTAVSEWFTKETTGKIDPYVLVVPVEHVELLTQAVDEGDYEGEPAYWE